MNKIFDAAGKKHNAEIKATRNHVNLTISNGEAQNIDTGKFLSIIINVVVGASEMIISTSSTK